MGLTQSSRRRLTVTYEVGGTAFNYDEETLFGKTSETLFDQAVITTFDVEQPWGDKRWTPSTGQLINGAKWNLLRYIPVKMRGAEDDKEEAAQSFASV